MQGGRQGCVLVSTETETVVADGAGCAGSSYHRLSTRPAPYSRRSSLLLCCGTNSEQDRFLAQGTLLQTGLRHRLISRVVTSTYNPPAGGACARVCGPDSCTSIIISSSMQGHWGHDPLQGNPRYSSIRTLNQSGRTLMQLALDRQTGEKVAIRFTQRGGEDGAAGLAAARCGRLERCWMRSACAP